MTDLNNPETIEIHGLRTITKLCHFGADNNMEGCTFTEIVERLFAELEKAKAQAVPEKKIYLTCEQLYAAANFGAPNKDPELLETELTIAWFEEAHSGSGYYVYISEYPEEGAMKLETESGAEG
ncbi:hypothetical protein [Acinetobacter nosocomialis]|uniref:hypothetical protein n=1 Tax=Acinetobacter nosocomialis TaxID=106654 RepID=UPI00280F1F45|nr:hypothetical protein [Acinetobacter nosocomialis]MDQ9030623.1 hypothetical protein [Acinetobacter nosocomialis]MDQ9047996.1 hypothetical protein [Acinetobacter nosocomialis]MDQ9085310.1 hypothetical protein [Acinetobacter nosocomialis]